MRNGIENGMVSMVYVQVHSSLMRRKKKLSEYLKWVESVVRCYLISLNEENFILAINIFTSRLKLYENLI